MAFQPAYEVTRVDSMQWNRTCVDFELPEQPTASADMEDLPAGVLAELRKAISSSEAR